jgi:hypothetical protein
MLTGRLIIPALYITVALRLSAAAETPECSLGINIAGLSKQLDRSYQHYNTVRVRHGIS